jgi:hypothetical protein
MSKQKQKGTAFETLIVRHLREHGFPYAERRALTGQHDEGDITGTPGVVWECKNHKTLKLSEWLRETETERVNGHADIGILVAKRVGVSDPGEQYAVMTVNTIIGLLKQAGY